MLKTFACLFVMITALAPAALSQPAMLTNARVQVEAANGNLARAFDARLAAISTPAWIGYEVPAVKGDHFICDWNASAPRTAPTWTMPGRAGSRGRCSG